VIVTSSGPFLAERLEKHEADVAALKATLERKESA
jgi:hypothetical protein